MIGGCGHMWARLCGHDRLVWHCGIIVGYDVVMWERQCGHDGCGCGHDKLQRREDTSCGGYNNSVL